MVAEERSHTGKSHGCVMPHQPDDMLPLTPTCMLLHVQCNLCWRCCWFVALWMAGCPSIIDSHDVVMEVGPVRQMVIDITCGFFGAV